VWETAGNTEKAIFVHAAHVAGHKPAITQYGSGAFGRTKVSEHTIRSLYQKQAFFAIGKHRAATGMHYFHGHAW
jgi:hypothetical protein